MLVAHHHIDQTQFEAALSGGFKAGVAGSVWHEELARLSSPEAKLTWRNGYEAGRKRRLLAVGDPDEHSHQCLVFAWADCMRALRPDLGMLFAVPNAGKRTPRQGASMKAEGLRPGFPDIGLLTARKGRHGLFIELKRPGGRATPEQKAWIERLDAQGYSAHVCVGWLAATDLIERYLDGVV